MRLLVTVLAKLKVSSIYRTTSENEVCVVTDMILIDLLTATMKRYTGSRVKRAIRLSGRGDGIHYKKKVGIPVDSKGALVVRDFDEIDFYRVQIITGYRSYLDPACET